MSRNNGAPLLSLHLPAPPRLGVVDDDDIAAGDHLKHKRWYHYLPLLLAIVLILAPHPSLIIVFVKYYYLVHGLVLRPLLHGLAIYTLTFMAFSSLIVVLARDPGPVTDKSQGENADEGEAESFMEALLAPPEDGEVHEPGKWCKKCNAPKPERAHHCGTCGRCVLKMDHHLHAMFVAFYAIVICMVIGSFCMYHIYLISTNQTTLESLSPFLLLRHISPLPDNADSRKLSNPPLEHELSFEQRVLVREAHRHIRLYDVGLRKNWAQVFGWSRPWGWVYRLLLGGGCMGDGKTFPRNPRADEMLNRLVSELVSADKDR